MTWKGYIKSKILKEIALAKLWCRYFWHLFVLESMRLGQNLFFRNDLRKSRENPFLSIICLYLIISKVYHRKLEWYHWKSEWRTEFINKNNNFEPKLCNNKKNLILKIQRKIILREIKIDSLMDLHWKLSPARESMYRKKFSEVFRKKSTSFEVEKLFFYF